jgi:hypothetical protein
MIKKVLLAILLVSFLATSAFAWEALGGRIGIGARQLDISDGEGDFPFITYDPDAIPALQLRLIPTSLTDRHWEDIDQTVIALAALYRLGEGNVVPYVGLELGVETYTDISTPANSYNRESGKLILGAEWIVLDRVSLVFDWDIFTAYTSKNTDGDVVDYVTKWFDEEAQIGFIIYLD